jgi:predicted nuclease of predicted toxin-antitoxin system
LAPLLQHEKFEVHTVYDEHLAGENDETILEAAIKENRTLLTFDTDFCNIRKYPPVKHCGIVVFRLKDTRWRVLKPRVKQVLACLKSPDLCRALVIVDNKRIRVKVGD